MLDRIIRKVETIGGVTTDWVYAYDPAGRLSAVTRDGVASAAYEYDANGNRTRRTSSAGIETGVVDAQDRLVTYGNTSYQYTDAGDLRRTIAGPDTTTYHYDALGALRWVTLPTGTRIDYVIDAMGRRIGKKVNGAMTQGFLYESDLRIAAELSPSGAVLSRFVYGAQVNVPEYMERSGTRYRLITDHLGSVRLVVDATTGAVQQRLDYDEYGRVTANSNPGFQPFGYAGGLLDDASSLVRFGARDYDARLGRFITKDPIGLGGGANAFGYAEDDPANQIDPQGDFPIAGALIGGAGDLAYQLYNNGGNINCVNWWEVGSWALTGSGVGMIARSGLGVASFFYNARSFSSISRAYWLARGGAAGMSLDHWAISQAAARSGAVSSGVVNAGWNLLEMPGTWNTWLGFAPRWGGSQAVLANAARTGIQAGVPGLAAAGGYAGYQIGGKAQSATDCGCK